MEMRRVRKRSRVLQEAEDAILTAEVEDELVREIKQPKRGRRLPKDSGIRGVHLVRGKWQGSIKVNGKQHYLGTFATAEETSHAVDHFEKTGETLVYIRQGPASGYTGVRLKGTRWEATSKRKDGRPRQQLGLFETAAEAAAAVRRFDATGEIRPEWKPERPGPKSGCKGVTIQGNRFLGYAYKDGVKMYLGCFESKKAASAAVAHYRETGEKLATPGRQIAASGYAGVSKKRNKWAAAVTQGGTQHHLGTWGTPKEASKAVEHFKATGERLSPN